MKRASRSILLALGLLLVVVITASLVWTVMRIPRPSGETGKRAAPLAAVDAASVSEHREQENAPASNVEGPRRSTTSLGDATGAGSSESVARSPLEPETAIVQPPSGPPQPPVAPPASPGMVPSVTCLSGDMADHVTFEPSVGGGPVSGYVLSRSRSVEGPYSEVATVGAEARAFVFEATEPGIAYYTVTALGSGGRSEASEPVANAHVSLAVEVGPFGRAIASSNGEVRLVLAEGSFDETTTVAIEEVSGSPTGGIVSLAGVYEITPSGRLAVPATLSIAYELAVTHHQVSDVLLRAAALMTFDEAAGRWVDGATDVSADDGYLTGTVDHFSYWTDATIQPHGTSGEAIDYCSGVCHDLTTYPGSAIRYDTRDQQICYNCHGADGSTLSPPAGAPGPNIQAEFYAVSGQTRPASASTHPVAIGDLYCTACHDPHAAPSKSPGLLKALDPATGTFVQGGNGTSPGTAFCWTCHGTSRNRRIDYLVPGYYTRTSGDKKTRFTAGAHSAGTASTQRLDSESELQRGVLTRVQVNPAGTVTLPTAVIDLPKTATPVASPVPSQSLPTSAGTRTMYDYDPNDQSSWSASAAGASAGNGWIGTASVTVDLGVPTQVESFVYQAVSTRADVVQVQTSTDNTTFTPLVSQGVLGTQLPATVTLTGSATCRYVRFIFQRNYSLNQSGYFYVNELTVRGRPLQGTFEMRVDIPRSALYAGGVLRWQATTPASTTLSVTARASTNNGADWIGPVAVTNGGSLSQITNGTSLQGALMEISVAMTTSVVGETPTLDWLEVTTTRGAISGAPPAWSGEPLPNECLRCHVAHGSPDASLVNGNATLQCTTCHTAAYGGTYFGPTHFNASAHATVQCTGCHGSHGTASGPNGIYGFLLKDTRQQVCFSCHESTKQAFQAYTGAATEYAMHDIYPREQIRTGSRIRCGNCHSVHSSSGLVNPDAITTPYTALRDDPTSIPTQEVVIYANKDTLLDSVNPTFNYGAATSATVNNNTRLLLSFDLSSIPAGATIQNATLVLWSPSLPGGAGGYNVYPITRDWVEGTGTGQANDASINGATWLERMYGDNIWTGSVAGGDWAVAGGDRGGVCGSQPYIDSTNTASLLPYIETMRQGTDYGLMIGPYDASSSFLTYTRHAAVKYQPKLRIVYRTGPATRQVIDDVTFCLKCHDGNMPLGLRGQTMLTLSAEYAGQPHGSVKGWGPESQTSNRDQGGGGLKAPFYYGMDPLPCVTCHDPHGSRLPFHLKETVNGRSMVPPMSTTWGYGNAMRSVMGMASVPSTGWFCGACHIYPSNHQKENDPGACMPCHGHSGSRG